MMLTIEHCIVDVGSLGARYNLFGVILFHISKWLNLEHVS